MSKVQMFKHHGRLYRVIGRTVQVVSPGYIDTDEEHYNVLQIKLTNLLSIIWNLSTWKDVEVEHVPSHAWISMATIGDTGGWQSKLLASCYDHMKVI